jgi:hypothetical protein
MTNQLPKTVIQLNGQPLRHVCNIYTSDNPAFTWLGQEPPLEVIEAIREWKSQLIEGPPNATEKYSALELASQGLVGLYEVVDVTCLNKLLVRAKSALKQWENFGEPAQKANKEDWKDWHQQNRDAWRDLYSVIDAIPKPIAFIGADGDRRVIGTNGLLTADRMLMYSEALAAKYALKGYALDQVQSFATIELETQPEDAAIAKKLN